jgi:hypothetical protein
MKLRVECADCRSPLKFHTGRTPNGEVDEIYVYPCERCTCHAKDYDTGYADGYDVGNSDGDAVGYERGYDQGYSDGLLDAEEDA